MNTLHKKSIQALALLVLLAAASIGKSVAANEGVYFFCVASTEDKKTTYISELIHGKLGILEATAGFQDAVKETFGVELTGAKCTAYGSESEPVEVETAKKLWSYEASKNSVDTTLEILEWRPQQ